jgi:hypothetical protein
VLRPVMENLVKEFIKVTEPSIALRLIQESERKQGRNEYHESDQDRVIYHASQAQSRKSLESPRQQDVKAGLIREIEENQTKANLK